MERATRSAMLSIEQTLVAADLTLTRAEVFEAMGDGSEHEEGDPLSVEVDVKTDQFFVRRRLYGRNESKPLWQRA